MTDTPDTDTAAVRAARIDQALDAIKRLHENDGITRASLAATAAILEKLAAEPALFPLDDFPPPAPGATSARYPLHVEADQSYALYLNAQRPGKSSVPHNHKTWAVIVAVRGEELNRVYRRLDDGTDPGHGRLELDREVLVKPGTSVAYLGDDIHSIHVGGDIPTLHFHLYGRALETLTERVAFDLDTHTVTPYNQTHWRPNAR